MLLAAPPFGCASLRRGPRNSAACFPAGGQRRITPNASRQTLAATLVPLLIVQCCHHAFQPSLVTRPSMRTCALHARTTHAADCLCTCASSLCPFLVSSRFRGAAYLTVQGLIRLFEINRATVGNGFQLILTGLDLSAMAMSVRGRPLCQQALPCHCTAYVSRAVLSFKTWPF